MSSHGEQFIEHLERLRERERGAIAILRRSLSFAPGAYAPAYVYVERFVGAERGAGDPFRLALYGVAGLYALNPVTGPWTLAEGLANVMLRRESGSVESRFLALLEADAENVAEYLRHAVTLLAADGVAVDYTALLADLTFWLNPYGSERRDRVRQEWARKFYGVLARAQTAPIDAEG